MKISQRSDNPRMHEEESPQNPETAPQNDEAMAWEPIGDNLWLPRRIRGSWRGGVLG